MRDLHRQLKVMGGTFDLLLENLNKAIKELKIEGGAGRELMILMEPALQFQQGGGGVKKGKESLYMKFGGEQAIEKIVTIFYNKILQNQVLKEYFKNVEVNKLRNLQKQFLCFKFGGPNPYTGKTMRDSHWHLELQDVHFDTFKDLMRETLKEFKIAQDLQDEFEQFLESLRKDIVSIVPPLIQRLGGENNI